VGTEEPPDPEPIWSGTPCPSCGSNRTLILGGTLTCCDPDTCWIDDSDWDYPKPKAAEDGDEA
jgi:hypothetical protein